MTQTAATPVANAQPRVLVESSRALPLVSMSIAFPCGSALDPAGKEGLTRIVARMMRRTGGGLTAEALDERIDALGASLGPDVAQTSVGFSATVIARSLEPFIDVFASVLGQPSLAESEFSLLQRETVGELVESRDNDRSLARRWFRRNLFPEHAYSRTVSGTVQSIRSIAEHDVRPHYDSVFVRSGVVFAFAGDITPDRATECARRLWEAVPARGAPRDPIGDPSMPAGRRLVIVDKPERTQTQILIGGLGTHPADSDHTALLVANCIFGGTFTARMTQEIRSKRGWSYGAYSNLPYDRRRQAFSMWTFPKATDAAPCIRLELELLKQWREQGVTPKELAWAKRYLVRSHAFAVDTAAKRVGLALEEVVYSLPDGYFRDWIERVQAVTVEQANAAVRERISEENLLVTVVGTEAEIGGAVRDAIDGLGSTDVVRFDRDD